MVYYTHNFISQSLVWNFHPNDMYSISNLPIDNLSLSIERLEFAVNGFIKGQIFDESIFELQNPILKGQ